MPFSYGENIKLTLFGQSHAQAVGVVIEGLPVGEAFDMDEVRAFMQRRRARKERTNDAAQRAGFAAYRYRVMKTA